ncbi:MAG: MBL fold metallo-hydrolase [Clostridia bacterium]|nr:MBL fold metallo-hydrolase [Clostridia bacterium]
MGKKFQPYVDIMQPTNEVTGSFNLCVVKLPTTTVKFIVDCGMYQEPKYEEQNNSFKVNPESVDFAILTHNHVDHNGRFPFFVRSGFRGNIYTTKVTQRIVGKALFDNLKVLKSVNKYNKTAKTLYNETDVATTLSLMIGCEYNKPIEVNDYVRLHFVMNGHIFGAASVLVEIHHPGVDNIYIFVTGDYNNKNTFFFVPPIRKWMTKLPMTLIIESTYAYMESSEITWVFRENIAKAIEQGKTIVVPAYSLGRAQEVLWTLRDMQEENQISYDIPIYYDGKLSSFYTDMVMRMQQSGLLHFFPEKRDFQPEFLQRVKGYKKRKKILQDSNAKIIVTSSGNGSYGAAQSYIKQFIQSPKALIHFTGYCPEGTLGYNLKTTPDEEIVWVSGAKVVKRADVQFTNEFSAHAKADELIDFLKQFENLKLVLVTHGTTENKSLFADRIVKEVDCNEVGILGEEYFYRVNSYGLDKAVPTKFR